MAKEVTEMSEQTPETLPAQVIGQIAAEYGLDGLRQDGPPREGTGYMTFRTTTSDRVLALRRKKGSALKISYKHPDIGKSIERQNSLMLFLQEQGFPVAAPLLTKNERTYVNILGIPYSLYPFVDGTSMDSANPPQLKAWGETLARYHQLTARYYGTPPKTQDSFPNLFQTELAEFRKRSKMLDGEFNTLGMIQTFRTFALNLNRTERELRRVPYDSLPRVVIHGDYKPGNVLFQGDRLVAVIDFGVSRREVRIFDLAKAISGLIAAERKKTPVDAIRVFFHSYDGVERLDNDERMALPTLIQARIASKALEKLSKIASKNDVAWKVKRAIKFRDFAERLQWLRDNEDIMNRVFDRPRPELR